MNAVRSGQGLLAQHDRGGQSTPRSASRGARERVEKSWPTLTAEPGGLDYLEVEVAGLPELWAVPKGSPEDRVIFSVHAGGGVSGPIYTRRRDRRPPHRRHGRFGGRPAGPIDRAARHGPLGQTLLEHHLLDELRFWIHPLIVGTGGLIFRAGENATLKLAETTTLTNGVVILTYRPAHT